MGVFKIVIASFTGYYEVAWKTGPNFSPQIVRECNSTQHRPSVERSLKMANTSQTNGKFEFYLSWKYPCMKQYRENPVYKTSKESAHCKRTESDKNVFCRGGFSERLFTKGLVLKNYIASPCGLNLA